jgi:hypothetical protein
MTIAISGTTGITLDGQFNSASSMGFKNRIINGAMVIDQRNAGASVTVSSDNSLTLDRWKSRCESTLFSSYSVQQSSTTPAGFVNSLLVTSLTAASIGATAFASQEQRIEGLNMTDFGWGSASAVPITVSFWVRSSLTGIFGGYIQNSAQNRAYVFTYTVNAANTWEQKSVTISGDTSGTWLTTNGIGLRVGWNLGTGTTFSGTAGSWGSTNYYSATGSINLLATNGATFYITGVQLEKGSTATSFDYRPYGTELSLCQRYFYNLVAAAGVAASTTKVELYYQHPVPMRAAPTLNVVGVMRVEDVAVSSYTQSSATSTLEQASYLGMKAGFGNLTSLTSARAYFVASLASNVTASPPTGLCQVSAEL